MGEFLNALFEPDDLLEVRFLPSKRRLFAKASDLATHIDRLRQESHQGENIYVSANPRMREGGKAKDVGIARSVFVDMEKTAVAAAAALIKKAGLPTPTVLVDSGHGVHAYWRLAEPITDLKQWKTTQKHLAALLGSDPKVSDASRVMRLPGFANHKPPAAVSTLAAANPQHRYSLRDLMQQSERSESSNGSNRDIEHSDAMIAAVNSVDSVASIDSANSVGSVTLLHEQEQAIRKAIACTLPQKEGQRHRAVFEFARALKAIPKVAELPARDLKPVVRRWHKAAMPKIATQAFDETWGDFVASWRNVRFALGESPLDQVFQAIQTRQPPPECSEYDTPKVRLLVALCAELQHIEGDADFYLDCRSAAKLLEVDPVTVWRWLKMISEDGFLLEKITGKPGMATRWRWVGRKY